MIVAAACIAVYAQAVGFDFVNWDDDLYVTENPSVLSPADTPIERHLLTPYLGYPVPLTMATYIAEHAIFGLDPAVFHATNILLHVTVCLVLLLVVRRLGCPPWTAAICVVMFTLHPACVEPVTWISGRKELLAALFVMLAFASYLGLAKDDRTVRSRLPAAALLLAAALSKPSALLMPAVFAWNDRKAWPWTAVLGVNACLGAMAYSFETSVGALGGPGGPYSVVERVLAAAYRHSWVLVQPFDLSPKYLDPVHGIPAYQLVMGGVALGAAVLVFVYSRSQSNGSWLGIATALAAYVPVSGIVPLNRQYSDSYLYLPLAGLAMAMAPMAHSLLESAGDRARSTAAIGALVLALALGLTSAVHAPTYRDGVSLWASVHRKYPDSPQACRNLGNAFMFSRRHQPTRAAAVYRHCIALLDNRPFYLKNLAIATFMSGDRAEAERLFREYASTRPRDPTAAKYLRLLRRSPKHEGETPR